MIPPSIMVMSQKSPIDMSAFLIGFLSTDQAHSAAAHLIDYLIILLITLLITGAADAHGVRVCEF